MEQEPNKAWAQPLTFGGVASFAEAPARVLAAYQLAVAVLAAAVVVTSFELAWVPVLERAIASLPPTGAIQNGELHWTNATPVRTTGSSFLWIGVDPSDSTQAGEGADLQIEAKRTEVRIRSLFGYLAIPYLKGYRIAMNRTDLEPWWGAWHPAVLAGIAGGVLAGLFVVWTGLGFAYAWPVRLIAFYADRRLSWMGAWRIGVGALLPGAIVFSLAILAYTFHRMNFVQLLAAALLHIMIGWVYILFAPFSLAEHAANDRKRTDRGNPFGAASARNANPFSGPPRP